MSQSGVHGSMLFPFMEECYASTNGMEASFSTELLHLQYIVCLDSSCHPLLAWLVDGKELSLILKFRVNLLKLLFQFEHDI